MMQKKYDLISIGAGSAGLAISISMKVMGFRVLLVDKSAEHIGGECLHKGCVPSKALIHVAKTIHQSTLAKKFGKSSDGKVDIHKVKQYINERIDIIRTHENTTYLRKKGIDVDLGEVKFTGKNSIRVNDRSYAGKNIVIATGSSPKIPDIEGLKQISYLTNEHIFKIDKLPEKMLIVGAGATGLEMAQAFSRLGSGVIVVDVANRILPAENEQLTGELKKLLEKEGIKFYLSAHINKFKSRDMAIVKTRSDEFNIQFDAVLIATGRTPNIHHLDIEKAGIHVNSGKIVLNEQMQTSNKHVFVSGDATGKFFYSQAAELESSVIFRNLIFPVKKKINYQDLSWVTFTDPEVATFGLTEHELKKQKQSYDVLFTDFVNEDKAIIDDYQYGKLKIFTKTTLFGKKRILGGTMLAPEAGNMIQELLFAKYNNISFTSFFDKIYPYPVSSRIIKDVAIEDRINTLKNWMKKIIRWLYSIN